MGMEALPGKAELRRQVRDRLRAVPDAVLKTWSEALIVRLQGRADLWAGTGTVALFGGLRNEPDLINGFMPWLRARAWRTVLFSVEGSELVPYEVQGPQDLKRGPLGVWEPVVNLQKRVPVGELTLILVPGLAFGSTDGSRLGRGGGFYDRLLAQPEVVAHRLGVCFHAQIWPGIPCEAHDVRVHEVLTEIDEIAQPTLSAV